MTIRGKMATFHTRTGEVFQVLASEVHENSEAFWFVYKDKTLTLMKHFVDYYTSDL